jgi:hydrogenase expression/formation protein HypD
LKYLTEYRNKELVSVLSEKISTTVTKPYTIMEICGGQTHSIMKNGLQSFLPNEIELVHGPGCPVCVTPVEQIDKALLIASREDVIFTSFGDMLRVPGTETDLLTAKAKGADVRIIYSPLDALKIAEENPNSKIVFFAVGFETTAPAIALAVQQAYKRRINNFFILNSHVLVPPAMETILSSDKNKIQGFIAAGHVCTIMGTNQYIPIAEKYNCPIVVTGFEPVDIMRGILDVVLMLEKDEAKVVNSYERSVRDEGNISAQKTLWDVFSTADRKWRGIGEIPHSGLKLNSKYESFDAEKVFDTAKLVVEESKLCIAGKILQGLKKPNNCSAFRNQCTPDNPLGAPMVSTEGACAAYYKYYN